MNYSQIEQKIVDYLKAKTSSVGAAAQMDERTIADAIAVFNGARAYQPTNIIGMMLTHPAVKPLIAACIVIAVAAALTLSLRSGRRPEMHIVSRPPDISSPATPNSVSQPNFVEEQPQIAADEVKMQLDRVAALYKAGDFNTVVVFVTKADPQTQQAIANYLSRVRDETVVDLLTRLSDEVCRGEPNNIFEAAIKNREDLIEKRNKRGAADEGKTQIEVKSGVAAAPEGIIMLKVPVKVVDEEGKPIAGATITPAGLGKKGNRWGPSGWSKERYGEPRTVTTDSQGLAEVAYPKYFTEKLLTGAISFYCSHPEFCTWRPLNYPVDGSARPVVLPKGAIVRVCGYIGSRNNRTSDIYVQADGIDLDGQKTWSKTGDGFLESKRILPIPILDRSLRILHFHQTGIIYFSDVIFFRAEKNKVCELVLELKPGIRVEGRLDDSVPRPVTNGKVAAVVAPLNPPNEQKEIPIDWWHTWRPIDTDGNFVFESLPAEQLWLTGVCDGFVSKSPPPPKPIVFCPEVRPQVFALAEPAIEVELLMEPAATCEVTVINEQNEPIKDANVTFWPNVSRVGTVFPGSLFRTEDWFRTGTVTQREIYDYRATTDVNGVAVVRNLPAFKQPFSVTHNYYEMPARTVDMFYGSVRRRDDEVVLVGGRTTKVLVVMQAKGTDVLGEKEEENIPPKDFPSPNSVASTQDVCMPEEPNYNDFVGFIVSHQVPPEEFPSRVEEPNYNDYVGVVISHRVPPEEFSGRVVDDNNNPIEGVLVDAWTWGKGNETYTDANGFFRLDGLKGTKTIEVRFSKDGFSPRLIVRQPLGVKDAVVVLDDKTYFEGSVADAKGNSVAGAQIRAAQGPKYAEGVVITEVWTETVSNDDGTYRLYVQPDKYDIQAKAKAGVARYQNIVIDEKQAKRFDIAIVPALTFRAKVLDVDTNKPVAGIRLSNWEHKDVNAASDKAGLIEIAMLPGKFEFGIGGGEYTRWWSQNCISEWNRFEIESSDKGGWQRNFDCLDFDIQLEMEPVTIFVERGVHIRGKVLDPQGNPVGGATVAPALTGTGNSITGDTRFSVETKQDGTFDMLLPASKDREYNLVAHDGKYGEFRKWANGVAEPIRTKPGERIDGVVLRLTVPATVRGKAIDKSGKPVASREVRASAFDKMENRYYDPTTETDANGLFELKFIRPGQHYIQVAPFWLDAEEAPQASQIVELGPDDVLEGIELVAEEEQTF